MKGSPSHDNDMEDPKHNDRNSIITPDTFLLHHVLKMTDSTGTSTLYMFYIYYVSAYSTRIYHSKQVSTNVPSSNWCVLN